MKRIIQTTDEDDGEALSSSSSPDASAETISIQEFYDYLKQDSYEHPENAESNQELISFIEDGGYLNGENKPLHD